MGHVWRLVDLKRKRIYGYFEATSDIDCVEFKGVREYEVCMLCFWHRNAEGELNSLSQNLLQECDKFLERISNDNQNGVKFR